MNIIGIAGRMGAGKDTVADMLVGKHGFVKVALADPIKRIAKELWGFADDQLWGPSEMRETPLAGWRGTHIEAPGRGLACARCGARIDYDPDVMAPPQCKLTARFALQRLGTECARSIDPDVWINAALEVAACLLTGARGNLYDRTRGVVIGGLPDYVDGPRGVVISDVRFPNEAKKIVEAGGVVWRIMRNADYLTTPAAHASERIDIDPSLIARTIVNNGTLEELAAKIDEAATCAAGSGAR